MMHTKTGLLVRIALPALVALATRVYGAPPNDNFANATPITVSSNLWPGTTVGATSEPGEMDTLPSVWWVFTAPANGSVSVEKDQQFGPTLSLYQGTVLTNLALVASSEVDFGSHCTFSADVQAGVRYYVRATTDGSATAFTFIYVFQPAAANDNFASRILINPGVQSIGGTTLGATLEANEPTHGSNSIWWSWSPTNSGPVILTTADSKFNTTLTVYTGTTLSSLALVASNQSAYVWGGTNGPSADPASRLKLNTIAGTTYQIAVSGGEGDAVLNFKKLGIETINSLNSTVQSDQSDDFTATVQLSNYRAAATGPLRIRLIARPWYISLDGEFFPCPDSWPSLNDPDVALGIFTVSGSGSINSSNSASLGISGTIPPPSGNSSLGFGYGVLAVLEEQTGGYWIPQDTRMIVPGDWAVVDGYAGPGGGVLLIVPSQSSATGSSFLQVHISPTAAVQAGAGWRLQGETAYHTDPNFTELITTNSPIVIQFSPVPGWNLPQSQTNTIPLEALTVVNASYTVVAPAMGANSAQGIGLMGTTNTTYRIEYRTNLASGTWLPLQTNTIGPGFNQLLQWPPTNNLPAAYFRAVWLP